MEAEYAYGAHFALRVLVLPVLPLRKQEYEKQLALLRQHSKIALADIPPTTAAGAPVSPLIAPSPASRGFLNLNFVEAWDAELEWLAEYQAHRRVMGVVGLLDCAEWTGQDGDGDLQDGARVFRDAMKEEAPAQVFANRCYAFNPRESQNDNAEGLVVIPNVGDVDFYINTLLAELASNMLAGVSQILRGLDSKTSVQMPMGKLAASSIPVYQTSARPSTPGTEQRMSMSVSGTAYFERSNSPLPPLPPSRPPSVIPSPGSPASHIESSDAKARKKHPGRIAKLKGDLFCLAGRPQEAMNSYNEATTIARANNDFAWQAASMEANIMTQTYQSWLHSAPPGSNTATPRPSISNLTPPRAEMPLPPINNAALAKELPPRYNDALLLYTRLAVPNRSSAFASSESQAAVNASGIATAEPEAIIHPLLYIESCMRCLRMQLALLPRGDVWDDTTVNLLIGSTTSWPRLSASHLFERTLHGSVTRSDIEATIQLAYSQCRSPTLRRQDRVQFLESITEVYDALHLPRRKAIITRELAANLSTEVAQEEDFEGEMDLAGDISSLPRPTIVKSRGQVAGSERVIHLLRNVCLAYSLPDPSEETKKSPSTFPSETLLDILNTIFESFGWLELQYALIKETIRISEALPDLAGALSFTSLALRTTSDAMASKEQRMHIEEIKRLNTAATKKGLSAADMYWGPDYLLSLMTVLSLPEPLRVVEQILKAEAADQIARDSQGFSDILVHSVVRRQAVGGSSGTRPTLIEGEPGEVVVYLVNPYAVPLQIDSIELLYSGVSCSKFPPVSLTLPPLGIQAVTLVCTPVEPGDLVLHGCKVRLAGCPERDFIVPANAGPKGDAVIRTLGLALLEQSRVKHTNFAGWHETKKRILEAYTEEVEATFLTCNVVPRQPMLQVRETNLAHGMAMLYEGETFTIHADLANTSDVHIDSLKIQLEDNVTQYQRTRLTSEETTSLVAYELEFDAQQVPVFRSRDLVTENKLDIGPNGSLCVEFDCYGKPGLTQGSIGIEYASLPMDAASSRIDRFYTRNLRIPLAFTVSPCLRCQRWNVMLLPKYPRVAKRQHRRNMSITSVGRALAIDEELEDHLRNLDDEVSCLLVVEVENLSQRQAFEAILAGTDGIKAKVKQRIEPNTTVNLLLPINKILLSEEHIKQAIPSISRRQFVVGKGALPIRELERFWYREELLRTVNLVWREVGSRKTGNCNLRHMALSDEMLSAIKLSDLPLTIDVSQNEEPSSQDDKDRWCVPAGHFTDLFVSLKNLKSRPITLSARIDIGLPSASDRPSTFRNMDDNQIPRNFIVDGSPIQCLPTLAGGAEMDSPICFPICFMSKGKFDVRLILEEIGDEDRKDTMPRPIVEQIVRFNVS